MRVKIKLPKQPKVKRKMFTVRLDAKLVDMFTDKVRAHGLTVQDVCTNLMLEAIRQMGLK